MGVPSAQMVATNPSRCSSTSTFILSVSTPIGLRCESFVSKRPVRVIVTTRHDSRTVSDAAAEDKKYPAPYLSQIPSWKRWFRVRSNRYPLDCICSMIERAALISFSARTYGVVNPLGAPHENLDGMTRQVNRVTSRDRRRWCYLRLRRQLRQRSVEFDYWSHPSPNDPYALEGKLCPPNRCVQAIETCGCSLERR